MLDGMDLMISTKVIQDREPGKASRARKPAETKPGQIKWRKLAAKKRGNPEKCDICVGAMVRGGQWSAPDPAVYGRAVDGVEELLCWRHTSEQRNIDGLPELKRVGR